VDLSSEHADIDLEGLVLGSAGREHILIGEGAAGHVDCEVSSIEAFTGSDLSLLTNKKLLI
jgi:hypothetical protein